MRSALWLACPLLLSLASGCGKFREISTCRAVIGEVNPTLSRIEELSKKPGAEPELQMAKLYGELGKRLQPHTAGTRPLAAAIKEYANVLEATGNALRSHVEATRKGTGRPGEPRRELERLVKRERTAATRLEVECHS